MRLPRLPAMVPLFLAFTGATLAAAIDGTWKAEFDSQVGIQKYVYELKADGEKLTGRALGERTTDKSETPISEGTIKQDDVYFVERLKYQGFDLRIDYRGKLQGDKLVLTRTVGGMFTENVVAHRVVPAMPR